MCDFCMRPIFEFGDKIVIPFRELYEECVGIIFIPKTTKVDSHGSHPNPNLPRLTKCIASFSYILVI